VRARLVVAADGANSFVRKAAGVSTWGWGYGQKAIVATVDVGPNGLAVAAAQGTAANEDSSPASPSPSQSAPQEALTMQRFLPSGPVALLPLWGGKASVIWSTDSAAADALCRLDDQARGGAR
jgi:2-polyprenyl-6-methoxyphenol hydroxylase-like FAD-dependent oxidoreductase